MTGFSDDRSVLCEQERCVAAIDAPRVFRRINKHEDELRWHYKTWKTQGGVGEVEGCAAHQEKNSSRV